MRNNFQEDINAARARRWDGLSFYGQQQEDFFLHEYYFKGQRDLVGIEVGATDGHEFSNTRFFEDHMGWDVLCIEANPNYERILRERRRRVECPLAVSNFNGISTFEIVELQGQNQTACSALRPDERLVNDHAHLIKRRFNVQVRVEMLEETVQRHALPRVDLVSIDTEGTELDVLQGFDIERWRPKVFIIENNYQDPDCRDYLAEFGYEHDFYYHVNDFYVRKD